MTTQRNIGLDILRCCAILPVLVYHTPLTNGFLEQLGYIGVEIFFSLSGYLVLQMIFERFDRMRSLEAFVTFLTNRWMRTFPLYFLFLAINVAITRHWAVINPHDVPVFGTFAVQPDVWPFATFTQNLLGGGKAWNDGWFGVSWSLSLEEWFYILLPAALLLFWSPRFLRLATGLLLAIIAVSIAARTARFLLVPEGNFDELFRRPVLFRLDAFCYGALVFVGMTAQAGVMRQNRRIFATVGGLALLYALFHGPIPGSLDYFTSTLYYTFVPAAVALMIPAFCHLDMRSKSVARLAYFISSRTYALYLCHLPVTLAYTLTTDVFTPFSIVPLLAAHVLVADLLYRCIERPILRLRPEAIARRSPDALPALPTPA